MILDMSTITNLVIFKINHSVFTYKLNEINDWKINNHDRCPPICDALLHCTLYVKVIDLWIDYIMMGL